jgi:hypothetical protein
LDDIKWLGAKSFGIDNEIILEAKKRFKICEDWEAQARVYLSMIINLRMLIAIICISGTIGLLVIGKPISVLVYH